MKKILIIIILILLAGCAKLPDRAVVKQQTKPIVKSQTREVMLGADSGARSPGTMADDATVGTVAWGTPDNAKLSNNEYATATFSPTGISHYIKATNFGFNIPAGATINGILIEAELNAFNIDCADNSIKIIKSDGTLGTQNKARGAEVWWPVSDTYVLFGSSSDTWGESWLSTDINDIDFGAVISGNVSGGDPTTNVIKIDHIRITVYFSETTANSSSSADGVIFFDN